MRGVTKVFPGVKALDDVTFCVKPGSVHALCGENGAGKSTLMKVLAGIYKQEAGDILIEGKKVQITDAHDAMEKGIAMIHQELNYYPDMTVEANLYIARENTYFAGIVNRKENLRQVHSILSEYGIELNPNARMRELTIAKQQMVEIVRAIAFNAKIIIMDEPTSSLTDNEIRILFQMIRKLASEGKAIIYISHKLDEITEIADTVTVIRDGKTIGSAPITELTQLDIIRMMVGRELTNRYPPKDNVIGDVLFEAEGLSSFLLNIFPAVQHFRISVLRCIAVRSLAFWGLWALDDRKRQKQFLGCGKRPVEKSALTEKCSASIIRQTQFATIWLLSRKIAGSMD